MTWLDILAVLAASSVVGVFFSFFLYRTMPAPVRSTPAREVYGRDDQVRQIFEILTRGGTGAITPAVIITGGGGVGKTTLARYYISVHRRHYVHAHLIPAETEQQLLEHLAATVPGLEGRVRARAEAALRHINGSTDPWLIVYDNVPYQSFIENWIPNGQHTHCLVTTRSTDWTGPGFQVLSLSQLSPEAAINVLESEAGRVSEEARILARKLGFHPLALVQAGALLRENPTKTFAEYAEDLDEIIQGAPRSKDYPASIFASVSLSLRGLSADETALLEIFSFLSIDAIEPRLVGDLARVPSSWILDEIPLQLHELAGDPARLEHAFASLVRRSLLAPGPIGEFSLHVLTAKVVRARLGDGQDDASAAAAAVIAANYPTQPHHYENWPDCARLTPHVAALHRHPPATAAMDYLYNLAALYLAEQADLETALAYAEASLKLKIARLGRNDRDVGAGHTNLGLRFRSLGRLEAAEEHLREALRITEALGGGAADDDLPKDLSNLASTLADRAVSDRKAGDAESAVVLFSEAEELLRRALDLNRYMGDRAGEATCLNNLAALKAATDEFPAAIEFAEEALAIVDEFSLPGDPRLATSLHNLGSLLLRAGDPAAARAPLERALAIYEAAFPDRPGRPPHPHRVAAAQYLAACLFALDPPEMAAAEALGDRYGFDPDEIRAAARAIMAGG